MFMWWPTYSPNWVSKSLDGKYQGLCDERRDVSSKERLSEQSTHDVDRMNLQITWSVWMQRRYINEVIPACLQYLPSFLHDATTCTSKCMRQNEISKRNLQIQDKLINSTRRHLFESNGKCQNTCIAKKLGKSTVVQEIWASLKQGTVSTKQVLNLGVSWEPTWGKWILPGVNIHEECLLSQPFQSKLSIFVCKWMCVFLNLAWADILLLCGIFESFWGWNCDAMAMSDWVTRS